MGFTPAQVWDMSLWEFAAALAGWRAANTVDAGPAFPTAEQHAENLSRVTIH